MMVRKNAKEAKTRTPGKNAKNAKTRTLRAGSTPGTVDGVRMVSDALDQRLGVFMVRLRQARTKATEPAVHDLRVSMRRLIAALDLAREVAPDAGISSLRRKLRRSLKAFNAMRDVHISLLAMIALGRRVPAVRPYVVFLRTRERVLLRASGASLKAIDAHGVERSVATVQGFLFAAAADPAVAAAIPAILKGAMGRTYVNAVRALRNVNAADATTIHRLRISFKKLRYTIEVLAPLTGGLSRTAKKWMGEYQTLMGEVQDCEVMIAGARRFAAVPVAGRRIPMIAVQEELARRKSERLGAFLERARELERRITLS
jgi:CHAD domain-containing protein